MSDMLDADDNAYDYRGANIWPFLTLEGAQVSDVGVTKVKSYIEPSLFRISQASGSTPRNYPRSVITSLSILYSSYSLPLTSKWIFISRMKKVTHISGRLRAYVLANDSDLVVLSSEGYLGSAPDW